MTGHRTPPASTRVLAAYRLLRAAATSPDPWLTHPMVEADLVREAAAVLRGKPREVAPW